MISRLASVNSVALLPRQLIQGGHALFNNAFGYVTIVTILNGIDVVNYKHEVLIQSNVV